MSYQQERDEFIARMTREGLPLDVTRLLLREATGLDRRAAVRAIVRLARRRRRTGHDVTHTIGKGGLPSYEFGEPADCALIPDTAGTAAVIEERQAAWECAECGTCVRMGQGCTCQEPIDDDEDNDDMKGITE